MRAFLASLVILVGSLAVAEAPAPSGVAAKPTPPWTKLFLWRIEGARPSYLLGTMHLPDARVTHLPAPIVDALNATDGVALELRMDLVSALEMLMRLRAPKGTSVAEVVPEPLRERLRKVVAAHHGNAAMVERLRPWMAGLFLGFLTSSPQVGYALDAALHDWAIDHGKPADGLETMAEQSTLGDNLPLAEQLAILKESIESLEKDEDSNEPLREAYFAGDERKTRALLADYTRSAGSAHFMKMLLDDRNVRLAERIRARLAAGGAPTFYAVGLAHVVGHGGIVERLRRAGYKVTPVR